MEVIAENCNQTNNEKKLEKFSRLPKTPPVDIEFQDLCYSIKFGGLKPTSKQILKSINGKFSSGELTAILGPSGSGKTTLLNVLAGYIMAGVSGTIKVNNRSREMKTFHKMSAYIMQEDLLQTQLTVHESMMIAAKLKLGTNISLEEKKIIVEDILKTLGLDNCYDTRTERLSGGQRKRLVIALELVNNPPVIFLDEPTSGLDSVTIKQCMDALRTLTGQGRTIICTIHQPSNSIFDQFNQVYFMTTGVCVYNGSPSNALSFLSNVGLPCPITYSPAEYIIEIVQTNEDCISILSNEICNGKMNRRNSQQASFHEGSLLENTKHSFAYSETSQTAHYKVNMNFPTSVWTQFYVLFGRMMIQQRRNKLIIFLQVFHHIMSGVLFGLIFYGIGNDASHVYDNFKFCSSVMVFFIYTHVMSSVLLFPIEVQMLKREYFNRWYGLKAYFMALTLRSMPMMIILGSIFLVLTYILSDQPLDFVRFMSFSAAGVLVAISSEGLGIAIGSIFNITNGSIAGPFIISPFLALSIYGMGYGSLIEPLMNILMRMSYLRYALVAICLSIYEGRPLFECYELYCHYRDPKLLLRDLGMLDTSYSREMLGLVGFLLLFRLIAFLALRYRLTSDFSYRIVNYATKILRHK